VNFVNGWQDVSTFDVSNKNCKKRIEELLKKNGKMYPSDIAKKIRCPYLDVMNNLNDLKKRGLVSIAR